MSCTLHNNTATFNVYLAKAELTINVMRLVCGNRRDSSFSEPAYSVRDKRDLPYLLLWY
jgi:hypothetical protein